MAVCSTRVEAVLPQQAYILFLLADNNLKENPGAPCLCGAISCTLALIDLNNAHFRELPECLQSYDVTDNREGVISFTIRDDLVSVYLNRGEI